MPVLREVVGSSLRAARMRQARTLREVSSSARVSLGYLSEIERGQKEASSELLAAICRALDVELSDLFAEVSQTLRREEKLAAAGRLAAVPAVAAPVGPGRGPAPAEASVRRLPTVAA
ncbi:MAG: helix-turn-helix domain-containing protein [Jatrophihabitans sp.]|uniref:helix-turn-helix domain-containing protein n=1 Tax=Jatrophihabitans sp. TaxID=1932789 RepID=UPI003F7D9871